MGWGWRTTGGFRRLGVGPGSVGPGNRERVVPAVVLARRSLGRERVSARITLSVVTVASLVGFSPAAPVSHGDEAAEVSEAASLDIQAAPLDASAAESQGRTATSPAPLDEGYPAFVSYPERELGGSHVVVVAPPPSEPAAAPIRLDPGPSASTQPEVAEPPVSGPPEPAAPEVVPDPRIDIVGPDLPSPLTPPEPEPPVDPESATDPVEPAQPPGPGDRVDAAGLRSLIDALAASWSTLDLISGADRAAAGLGAWWALVEACGTGSPGHRAGCASAADDIVAPLAGSLPDVTSWNEVLPAPRDDGYRLGLEVLPPAPAPFDPPDTLPGWAVELRRT